MRFVAHLDFPRPHAPHFYVGLDIYILIMLCPFWKLLRLTTTGILSRGVTSERGDHTEFRAIPD